MVVLNPNNWHWVDKNTFPWTKEYFEEKLVKYSGEINHGSTASVVLISSISHIRGDSNVSQRKGQPICYFDLDMSLNISIKSGDDDEVTGFIDIPEFMHDDSDYLIVCKLNDVELRRTVEKSFVPSLRELLGEYQKDLLREHSKYLHEQ